MEHTYWTGFKLFQQPSMLYKGVVECTWHFGITTVGKEDATWLAGQNHVSNRCSV